jgi:M6 family metalloprotease-like protein
MRNFSTGNVNSGIVKSQQKKAWFLFSACSVLFTLCNIHSAHSQSKVDIRCSGPVHGSAGSAAVMRTRTVQSGAKPFVSILVRFADSSTVTPYPKSYYEGLMGLTRPGLDHYWRENSYGKITLAGSKVVGWYNLPHPKSHYFDSNETVRFQTLLDDAAAVADADVNFPDYFGINIFFNINAGCCAWGGYGSQLDKDGQLKSYGVTWMPPISHNHAYLGHEIGHTLGFDHVGGTATGVSYDGDGSFVSDATYDTIRTHNNAFHKFEAGWIAAARRFTAPGSGSATIRLERIAQPVVTTDYLMAVIPTDDPAYYYTVESRRMAGYDAGIPGDGIVIFLVNVNDSEARSRVVGQGGGLLPANNDSYWTPGETFEDSVRGIRVKVNSTTNSGHEITISRTTPIASAQVTNTNDSGAGSLRAALLYANAHPASTVSFAIPASDPGYQSGIYRINLLSPLPALANDNTHIDGSTQPGFSSAPLIEINGQNAGFASGLALNSAYCTVSHLIINGFEKSGIEIFGAAAHHNVVRGCRIGTNATGRIAAPNGHYGLDIAFGATHNRIGGTRAVDRNVISGNGSIGIKFYGTGTSSNLVQGNFIGLGADGVTSLGNGFHGVELAYGASGNRVGGITAGEGNRIAYNAGNGIALPTDDTFNTPLQGNLIWSNADLGIDLSSEGVTLNDAGDSDTGANNLQNFPVLNSASLTNGTIQVRGQLNSTANTTFSLEIFSSQTADGTLYGEGQIFLGRANVTTDGNGNAAINVGLAVNLPASHDFICATATGPTGSTSEFSKGVFLSSLSISDAPVANEGNAGNAGSATFAVSLSRASTKTITVSYQTADGTAKAGSDYVAKSGTLSFAPGETIKNVLVDFIGDELNEGAESFRVNLNNAANGTIIDGQGAAIIGNDDGTASTPFVSINDVTITEGNSGTTNATFTVTLSAPSGQTVVVSAIAYNGTARSPADYTSVGARLTFAPRETTRTFLVPIKGDLLDEPNETFYVILSSPANAVIARGRGVGTINDGDAAPSILIDNLNIGEGNSGQRIAAVRLKLSAPSGQAVRISYATANGTATGGNDYVAVAPTAITFNVGSLYAYARVLINGDLLPEANETFFVNLSSPVNATIADNRGIGTILNDDAAPSLTINDVSITEGNSGIKNLVFTVTLSKASGQTVTANYASANGTAVSTSDYTAKSGALSFAPGTALTRTISIPIVGDTSVEGNETLYVILSGAVNASIGRGRGAGTINNDDSS